MPAIEFLKRLGLSASGLRAGWFQLDAASAAAQPDDDSLPSLDSPDNSVRVADGAPGAEAHMMSDIPSGEAERILATAKSARNMNALYRKAQLIGERTKQGIAKAHSTPRTEVEKRIVSIFQELLGHDNIDVDEEFFDAGGHSILTMRLLNRIRDAFGVDLPIRLLYTERLTIANLATIVEACSTPKENNAQLDTIKNALDWFSDEEITGLFDDLGTSHNSEI